MADNKQSESNATAPAPENDEKLLEDLEVDESTDVQGGRRIGGRMSPER